jgi:hypothetical protein
MVIASNKIQCVYLNDIFVLDYRKEDIKIHSKVISLVRTLRQIRFNIGNEKR